MSSLVGRRALAVAVCSFAVTSAAAAQIRVELGATIGRYAPLGSFRPAPAYSTALPYDASDLSGSAYGGQLRVWVAPRFGFELAGTTTSSSVGGGFTPGGAVPSSAARISTGTAQLLFRLTGEDSRARVWIGAGGGVIQHGGQAYSPYNSPVNAAGVFGVGSSIRISGGLSADVGVTSMIYNLNVLEQPETIFSRKNGVSERGTQFDMLLHTGLSYRLH